MNGNMTGTVLTYNAGTPREYDLVVSIDGNVVQLIATNHEGMTRFFLNLQAAEDVAHLILDYLEENPPPSADVLPFSQLRRRPALEAVAKPETPA